MMATFGLATNFIYGSSNTFKWTHFIGDKMAYYAISVSLCIVVVVH